MDASRIEGHFKTMHSILLNWVGRFTCALAGILLSQPLLHAQMRVKHSKATSGRIIVQPKEGVPHSEFEALRNRISETVRIHDGQNALHVVRGMGQSEDELIRQFEASGLVEFAEPDYILTASVIPNDAKVVSGATWGLSKISAPAAWNRTRGASNVVVAVIDSGIRASHEDLARQLWTNSKEIPDNGVDDDANGIIDDVHGINSIDGSGNPADEVGHGTHVAGIIGATADNGLGISGVVWSVQIMALKFIGADGAGTTSDAIECIDYARLHGAHIINASWGGGGSSQALRRAITSARSSGILFVAAAGNDGANIDSSPSYPASYTMDNIITVAASDQNDALASFSNYGATSVDIFAPGTSIVSCWHTADNAYVSESGTSMATPFVTGALALLKGRFPSVSYSQLKSAILNGSDKVAAGAGKTLTGGRLNVAAALNLISPETKPTLSITQDASGLLIQASGENGALYLLQRTFDLEHWTAGETFAIGDARIVLPAEGQQPSPGFFRLASP